MKKSTLISILLMGIFSLNVNVALSQQWEPTNFPANSTWVICQTDNGNIIAAQDSYPETNGKLFISKDHAVSWEACNVDGYNYSAYAVEGKSVFMGGLFGNVAISHDNGETWTISNLSAAFNTNISEDYPIYAMEYHNGKVYASVLVLGIACSDDMGKTWQMTDRTSLLLDDPENGGQWCYGLQSFKGKLYNVSAFGIWAYDDGQDEWEMIDDAWYSSGAVVHNDVLYVNYNAYGVPAGIRYTSDGENWTEMPIPENLSTSIRTLSFYGDALFMGHVSDAVLYTLNHGETWNELKDNFPGYSPVPEVTFYDCPMGFVFSDNHIICGVFSTRAEGLGVVKAAIPDNIVVIPTVKNVAATQNGQDVQEIKIAWDAATEAVVEGYNIYRDGEKINGAIITEAYYLDSSIKFDVEYCYTITAVGKETEGPKSAEACATAVYTGSIGFYDLETTINIYPNPVISTLYLDTEWNVVEYQIFNLQGRLVHTSKSGEKEISTSEWASGVYIIKITTENGVVNKRFVKQ